MEKRTVLHRTETETRLRGILDKCDVCALHVFFFQGEKKMPKRCEQTKYLWERNAVNSVSMPAFGEVAEI